MKQNVSEKNAALASKLTLMKLKQTAQGPPGLPEQSKYFCFIQPQFEQQQPSAKSTHPFFFSTKWPIGKCIEFLADKLALVGKFDLAKLKLFMNEEKMIESSFTVEELIKNGTFSNQGITILLKLI